MSDTQLPGVFADVQPVLEHYGYLAVGGFVLLEDFGVPVPGEILLISAAIFAGAGQLDIALMVAVAVLGAVVGDDLGYAVGRLGGRPLAERWGRFIFLTPRTDSIEHKHPSTPTAERSSRSPGSSRGPIMSNGLLAGIAGMHWLKFLGFNALGAALWVGTWAGLGFVAGTHMAVIYAEFERYRWYAIGVLVLIAEELWSLSACGVEDGVGLSSL